MKKKKKDINQLYYIKTIVCASIRSVCHYIMRFLKVFLQKSLDFIRLYKQACLKLIVPILIICIAYYACSASKRMISRNILEIFAISDEIRANYADKPDYWGLSAKEIITKKMIPSKYIKNDTLALSSGTAISIGSGVDADTVMPFSQTFDIIVKSLNKAQCISYAEAPLEKENLLKVFSIHILNKSGEFIYEWGGERGLPIERYATKNVCTDTDNTIIWSIK